MKSTRRGARVRVVIGGIDIGTVLRERERKKCVGMFA